MEKRNTYMMILTSAKKVELKGKLLFLIKQQEGNDFDYVDISKKLKVSYKKIFILLSELVSERKIIYCQKYLRKPILISLDDYTNLYWKVYIRSEEHPKSKLGDFGMF